MDYSNSWVFYFLVFEASVEFVDYFFNFLFYSFCDVFFEVFEFPVVFVLEVDVLFFDEAVFFQQFFVLLEEGVIALSFLFQE